MVMLLTTLWTPLMSVASLVTRAFSASFLAMPVNVTSPFRVSTLVFMELVERWVNNAVLTWAVTDASSIFSPVVRSVFSGAAANVSAVAADIVYDPKLLGSPALTLGPKGEAAGKDVFSAGLGHGKMRIGVAGINAGTLSDGVIA